jgi:hypothetical protein
MIAVISGGSASASAATQLGSSSFVPANFCGPDTTYIQTVSPGPQYSAPFSGVITSWSFQPGAVVPTTIKLKVGRTAPGADLTNSTNIMIVGESATETPSGTGLNTFPTRIPVQAGDHIGDYITGTGNVNCATQINAYTDQYDSTDTPVGTTRLFTAENFQEDISALLEPDADHDGFGDETQDQCPTNAATQGPCPAPKKKCKHKKKHKSAAVVAKKCKKKHH